MGLIGPIFAAFGGVNPAESTVKCLARTGCEFGMFEGVAGAVVKCSVSDLCGKPHEVVFDGVELRLVHSVRLVVG